MAKVNERDRRLVDQIEENIPADQLAKGWSRWRHDSADTVATYREEIEARYAPIVEALETVLSFKEFVDVEPIYIVQAREALAKIGRG